MPKQLNEWLNEFVENGADPKKVTEWPEEAGGGSPIEEGTGIKITGEDTKTISIDEDVVAKKSDIGNGDIDIYQGGIYKGGFKLNQKVNESIELDLGATECKVRTLGSILAEGFNKVMVAGIVSYEGLRNLVKQHSIDAALSNDCYLHILPIINSNDLSNPRGLLSIHYWYNSCDNCYVIDIKVDSSYGSLSGQTSIEVENDLDFLSDLVDYLYDNSINTEVTVKGGSGYVTGPQNNTLCVNSIRFEESSSDYTGYDSRSESALDTSSIISTIFTSSAS